MTDLTGWLDWPLIAKGVAGGIGLGSIYGVATGRFLFGLLLGAAAGFGFAVGRAYTS